MIPKEQHVHEKELGKKCKESKFLALHDFSTNRLYDALF